MIPSLQRLDAWAGISVDRGARAVLLFLLALAAVFCLTYQVLAISHRYPLDYGEAPLVDQAMRLAAGQNIYRADLSTPPYLIANYPPLYVAALIPFVKLFGPSFIAGRAISALCAWASGVFLGLIIHAQTRDRLAGLLAGLLFMAFPFVVTWSSLLRIDLLALALSLAGLFLLARLPITRGRLIGAALLLVAAAYTRQSYALAAPLAAFVWLWAHQRRQAFGLAALVGGLGLALFVVLNALTRGGFYFNIVTANVNEFGMERLSYNLQRFRDAAFILLYFGGASLLLLRRWNAPWPMVAPYVFGAVLSALTVGKIGSNVNYFLELCAALSLAAGSVVAWSRKHTSVHTFRAALLVLLSWQAVVFMQTSLREYAWQLHPRREAADELRQLETIVAQAEGAILADEYMGLITLQGRPLTLQPFEVTQLAQAGVWDQSTLVQGIRDKEFALILIHHFPGYAVYKERWTPEMLAALEDAYMATNLLADTVVYRPAGYVEDPAEVCAGAPWRLPSSGVLGVRWQAGGLEFYGRGNARAVPVYAVADGLLTRLPDWLDAVAIQHDDPLQPGRKVWSYYTGMADGNGADSYVAPEFPPGAAQIPVTAGQLLGYQGTWSGRAQWPMWMHVGFFVVPAEAPGAVPVLPGLAQDPSPYLGLAIEPMSQASDTQPLDCEP